MVRRKSCTSNDSNDPKDHAFLKTQKTKPALSVMLHAKVNHAKNGNLHNLCGFESLGGWSGFTVSKMDSGCDH